MIKHNINRRPRKNLNYDNLKKLHLGVESTLSKKIKKVLLVIK